MNTASHLYTFTARDLEERASEFVHDAEGGNMSIVTQNGRPVLLAVPFDAVLLRLGVNVALAVRLFDLEVLSLDEAARLAGLTKSQFMAECSALEVAIVRYSPDELRQELEDFDGLCRQ